MKIPILKLKDKDGKEIAIPAIRGPRGPAGDGTGDMVAEVYDPQGKAADIFQDVDDTVAPMNEHREGLAEAVEQMQAMLEEQSNLIEELSARVEELEKGPVEPDPEPDPEPEPDEPGGDGVSYGQCDECGSDLDQDFYCTNMECSQYPHYRFDWSEGDSCPLCGGSTGASLDANGRCSQCGLSVPAGKRICSCGGDIDANCVCVSCGATYHSGDGPCCDACGDEWSVIYPDDAAPYGNCPICGAALEPTDYGAFSCPDGCGDF